MGAFAETFAEQASLRASFAGLLGDVVATTLRTLTPSGGGAAAGGGGAGPDPATDPSLAAAFFRLLVQLLTLLPSVLLGSAALGPAMALAATALVRRDRGTAAVATMLLAQLTMGFRKHRGGGGGGGGEDAAMAQANANVAAVITAHGSRLLRCVLEGVADATPMASVRRLADVLAPLATDATFGAGVKGWVASTLAEPRFAAALAAACTAPVARRASAVLLARLGDAPDVRGAGNRGTAVGALERHRVLVERFAKVVRGRATVDLLEAFKWAA